MNDLDMPSTPAPVPKGGGAHSRNHTLVLTALTGLGIYLCYRLVLPFLSALVWALALAVAFAPFHRWLESRLKARALAAAVSVLVVGLIVVVPATFVAQRLVVEAAKGAELFAENVESGDWRVSIGTRPRLMRVAETIEQQVDLPAAVQSVTAWLTQLAKSIVKGAVAQGIVLLLTFYFLFFLFRDRGEALQSLRSLSPLQEAEMDRLLQRVGETIHATIYGTLVVAAVQGLLGGLMFWCLGLSVPLLWGVVMAVLSVVPVLGAFVVWIPAALFLALEGHWAKALILTGWGILVVGSADNLLRPILVGNRLKLHTVFAFIPVVGGVLLFGAAGLILGPVVLTITAVLLESWRRRMVADPAATPSL